MTNTLAVMGTRIFDGHEWHANSALVVRFGRVVGIVDESDVPTGATALWVSGGSLVPGFVDLQVNGGGGTLFNNDPTVEAIRTICSAHARFGTTALLTTLITDAASVTKSAIEAGIAAGQAGVPGFLGLHLEGPHLAVSRKGTHEGTLVRPMDPEDLTLLVAARQELPNLMVTVAAETVDPAQIRQLAHAGIIVSVGHSDADFATASAAFAAGATQVTHLFNAMSQLQNREPGVVGAALDSPLVHCGLIADGIHVHPATIRVALAAKRAPGRLFLVTDAMSQTGTDLERFMLNGRTVYRANGALRLADGTLAGADLDMIDAIHFMHENAGVGWDEALRMASLYPAQAIGIAGTYGHLNQGAIASFVHLNEARRVQGTWIGGRKALF